MGTHDPISFMPAGAGYCTDDADRSELRSDRTGTPVPIAISNMQHAFVGTPWRLRSAHALAGGCSTVQGDTLQPEERENPLTPLNAHTAKHYVSLRPATWAIAQVALGATPHNTRYAKSQPCICRVADSCDFTKLCSLCDIIF